MSMTVDEISLLAYRGEKPDVHDMTVPEWLLWYRLRDAYREFAGNPDAGAEAKKIQVSQYQNDRKDWVKTQEVFTHMASYWKRIEPAARRFAMDRTVDNAVSFFESVYGVPLKAQIDRFEREEDNG